jgi:hypothetical protein
MLHLDERGATDTQNTKKIFSAYAGGAASGLDGVTVNKNSAARRSAGH